MHIKVFLKKLVAISVAVLSAVTLAGCFDLGDFSDESAYYEAFGEIGLVYGTREIKEDGATVRTVVRKNYSVKDYFYNKNTGENFSYGDPKDSESDEEKDIGQLPYIYMAIPTNQDMNIDSFALYFNAIETCSLEVFFYVVSDLPDDGSFEKIRLLGDPEYQQKPDDGKNPVTDGPYSDPDDSLIVAKATMQVKSEKWDSLIVDNWKDGDTVGIKKGQYLLLRFINNSGVNTVGLSSVNFRVTNLLIRADS